MLFNSIEFLIFLFLFYITIFFFKKNWKIVGLIFSIFFYGYWDLKFLFLLYLMALQGYFFGQLLLKSGKKIYLIIPITISLLILSIFKYFNFFLEDILFLKKDTLLVELSSKIILPLGISFYTFQVISFVFDVYKKKIHHVKIIDYLFFITFFPQLIAGPILRFNKIIPQFKQKIHFNFKKFRRGFYLIVWGFFLKICLADNASIYVDSYLLNPWLANSTTLFMSTIFFGFQIYGDFCGYSLIAIGICKTVNINVNANFNRPYFTKSFREFWKRWHISLSNFVRDYLYIPLGGNQNSKLKNYFIILTCMILSGFWHGASYFFIFWGFAHGVLIIIERWINLHNKFLKFIYRVLVLILIFALWIPFRVNNNLSIYSDLEVNLMIFEKLMSIDVFNFNEIKNKFFFLKVMILILITCLFDYFFTNRKIIKYENSTTKSAFLIGFMIFLIITFGNFNEKTFIYFQF
jgi:D-alanyl-lipoteichoic acid acyltransferase DltB (MBOAT superfamily)